MKRVYFKSSVVFMLMALLSACTDNPNYAPVFSHFPESPQEKSQYHVVQSGETLQSISSNNYLDYRAVAQWNNLPFPYKVNVGQSLRLFKPNLPADSKKKMANISSKSKIIPTDKLMVSANKPINRQQEVDVKHEIKLAVKEKKPTISIDNQKVLKLNFQWPVKGKVLKGFSQSSNKGIEIAGKIGQSVAASEAGKVVYSGQGLLGYGNLLIIKHNETYLSAYANNSRLLVAEGDAVNKGQTVAEVGQIGSKRAALHFEIRKNGKPVNPLTFLSKK